MTKELIIKRISYSYVRILVLVGYVALLYSTPVIYASELDFTVTPEIPTSQISESPTNYFDLKLQPNEQAKLKLKIVNFNSTEQTYVASIYNAWTNDNGIVEYAKLKDSNKIFGKYKTTDVAKLNSKEVTIGPSDTGFVYIDLTMPTDRFDGVIAGSISIKKTGLHRNFRRNIALLIRNSEKEMEPSFNIVDGQFVVTSDEKKIKFTLRNESGFYQNLVNVSINLTSNGKKHTKTLSNLQMAPWSEMDIEQKVDLEDEATKILGINVEVNTKNKKQIFTDTRHLKAKNTKLNLIKKYPVNNYIFLLYYTVLISLTLAIVCKHELNSRK